MLDMKIKHDKSKKNKNRLFFISTKSFIANVRNLIQVNIKALFLEI